jgi:hypothetical protein
MTATTMPTVRARPRRRLSWVAPGAGAVSVASGAAGAVLLASNPVGDTGAWLLVAAGPLAVVALSQIADRARSDLRKQRKEATSCASSTT